MQDIEVLTDLVRMARRAVAFTGAGMSTESGIPDFRSPGGIWTRHKPVQYADFMAHHAARVQGWKLAAGMYLESRTCRPNAGHRALAALEKRGHVAAVITQNIDGLHQDAGSSHVIELHGTNRQVRCQYCSRNWPTEAIIARWQAGEEAPACEDCGGPLKTATVSFGQSMPEEAMNRAAKATLKAELFIAMGSSLLVEPAASFPRIAKGNGASLVIINRDPTPLDGIADTVIRRPIGETLTALLERMAIA